MQKHEVVVTPLQIDNQNNINYLIGSKNISTKPLIPYDNLVCDYNFSNDLFNKSIILENKTDDNFIKELNKKIDNHHKTKASIFKIFRSSCFYPTIG